MEGGGVASGAGAPGGRRGSKIDISNTKNSDFFCSPNFKSMRHIKENSINNYDSFKFRNFSNRQPLRLLATSD